MSFVKVVQGHSPVVLGLPHTGTDVPPEVAETLNQTGRALADTDWNIHRLYDGLLAGVTTVRTRVHRYAIDVNRDPQGASLYPGQNTTGLCPATDFEGRPIYHTGQEPDAAEIARRLAAYHAPYHAALRAQLDRVRALHGYVILYDCHSIRGQVPFLFDGRLPDFNIGTDNGSTCEPAIEAATARICAAAPGYSHAVNGRFRGGWTTRHYADPGHGVHAIQMELVQATYMHEAPPWAYDAARATRLRTHLKSILTTLADWSPA